MTLSRDDIEALLPFLANDTLDGEERAEVERAVAADPALAMELAALKAIRETMQAEDMGASPGDFGLARLLRDVGKEEKATTAAPAAGSRPRFWQIAAALLMAVVIGQAVLLSGSGDSTGFELASGSEAALTVAFVPDATEAAIRATLLDAGVEITAGPSALGLYQLGLLEGVTLDEAEDALRAAGDVLESVVRAEN
jgi:anti-sigma factor RsiW